MAIFLTLQAIAAFLVGVVVAVMFDGTADMFAMVALVMSAIFWVGGATVAAIDDMEKTLKASIAVVASNTEAHLKVARAVASDIAAPAEGGARNAAGGGS